MSNVFISYAKEDGAAARMLANALQRAELSVWWDRDIPPGKTWDDVIGCALDAAACVIVLWSSASIHSRWVREEAEKAASRGCLIPVLIGTVAPPFGFGRIQAADLSQWRGDEHDAEFAHLLRAVSDLAGTAPVTYAVDTDGAKLAPERPIRRRKFLWIAGGVSLAVVTSYVAWKDRRTPPPVPEPVTERQPEPAPAATIGQRHDGCVDFADPVAVVSRGSISRIAVYHDGYIHGIRVWYGADGVGEAHGYTAGIEPEVWAIPKNERIARVVGEFAPATGSCKLRPEYVCRIQFFTNLGNASPSFGKCPGGMRRTSPFEVTAPAKTTLRTISGWANLRRHECLNRAVASMTFHFGPP